LPLDDFKIVTPIFFSFNINNKLVPPYNISGWQLLGPWESLQCGATINTSFFLSLTKGKKTDHFILKSREMVSFQLPRDIRYVAVTSGMLSSINPMRGIYVYFIIV